MFDKVLVANRGEIAVRITRTLHEMGIASVAVYSDADRAAAPRAHGRRGVPDRPRAGAARATCASTRSSTSPSAPGADAIHPGYGFLSREPRASPTPASTRASPSSARRASAMRAMGSKTAARARMAAAGVPIVPGGAGELDSTRRAPRPRSASATR